MPNLPAALLGAAQTNVLNRVFRGDCSDVIEERTERCVYEAPPDVRVEYTVRTTTFGSRYKFPELPDALQEARREKWQRKAVTAHRITGPAVIEYGEDGLSIKVGDVKISVSGCEWEVHAKIPGVNDEAEFGACDD